MKKFKQLLVSLGLGAMLMLGAGAAVSAASEGELTGGLKPEVSEDIILEDYDVPAGEVLSAPPTNSVKMSSSSLTSLSFKWDSAPGANGYRVYIGSYKASVGDSKYLGITTSPKCTIGKLLPGTPYSIRLQSVKLNADKEVIDKGDKYILFHATTKTAAINKISTDSKGKFTFRMYNPKPSDKSDDIVGYRVRYENMKTHAKATRYYNSRTGFTYTPKPNYFYKLIISPYILLDGKKSYGKSTNDLTQYIAQQPKLKKMGHTASSQSIGWNKVYGATSYSIYVNYPGTTTYKKVKQTTGLSYTLTGIKRGKDYRIKVIANRDKFQSASSTYYRIRL